MHTPQSNLIEIIFCASYSTTAQMQPNMIPFAKVNARSVDLRKIPPTMLVLAPVVCKPNPQSLIRFCSERIKDYDAICSISLLWPVGAVTSFYISFTLFYFTLFTLLKYNVFLHDTKLF